MKTFMGEEFRSTTQRLILECKYCLRKYFYEKSAQIYNLSAPFCI